MLHVFKFVKEDGLAGLLYLKVCARLFSIPNDASIRYQDKVC